MQQCRKQTLPAQRNAALCMLKRCANLTQLKCQVLAHVLCNSLLPPCFCLISTCLQACPLQHARVWRPEPLHLVAAGPFCFTRYYESIQIRSGSSMAVLTPAHTAAPMFSPLLLAAVVLAGAYAAITTAFNRNYELTTYKQQGKWQLVLLWPVLALFSRGFRQQFSSALRGEKVKVLQSMEEQQAGNTIDSS